MNSTEWTAITDQYVSACHVASAKAPYWQRVEYYLYDNEEWQDWNLIKIGSTTFYWFVTLCSEIRLIDRKTGMETDCIVGVSPELYFEIQK